MGRSNFYSQGTVFQINLSVWKPGTPRHSGDNFTYVLSTSQNAYKDQQQLPDTLPQLIWKSVACIFFPNAGNSANVCNVHNVGTWCLQAEGETSCNNFL